jgi:hypothetical protein
MGGLPGIYLKKLQFFLMKVYIFELIDKLFLENRGKSGKEI